MNGCTVKSNKSSLRNSEYTHINLPIFNDTSSNQIIGCMEDIDVGTISQFGIPYTGYDPSLSSSDIKTWSDFILKLNGMLTHIKNKLDEFGSNISSIEWVNCSVSSNSIKSDETVTLTPGIINITLADGTKQSKTVINEYIQITNGTFQGGNVIKPTQAGTMTISVVYEGKTASPTLTVTVTNPSYSLSISPSTGNLSSTTTSITLSASTTPTMSSATYSWSLSGIGAKLSSNTGTSVQVLYDSPENPQTVTVTCTASSSSSSATAYNTAIITCAAKPAETQGKYIWSTFTLTENEWRTNYNQNFIVNKIKTAWENPTGYVNNRPTTYSIPKQIGDVYFVGIVFPAEFGEAEWVSEINGAKMNENKYTPLPEGVGGIYLTYENLTNSFIASGKPAELNWKNPAVFNPA